LRRKPEHVAKIEPLDIQVDVHQLPDKQLINNEFEHEKLNA
jgi:hypothetical protein